MTHSYNMDKHCTIVRLTRSPHDFSREIYVSSWIWTSGRCHIFQWCITPPAVALVVTRPWMAILSKLTWKAHFGKTGCFAFFPGHVCLYSGVIAIYMGVNDHCPLLGAYWNHWHNKMVKPVMQHLSRSSRHLILGHTSRLFANRSPNVLKMKECLNEKLEFTGIECKIQNIEGPVFYDPWYPTRFNTK